MRSLADAVRRALIPNRTRRSLDFETASLDGEAQVAVMDSVAPPKESIFKGDGVLVTPTPVAAGEEVQIWYAGSLAKSGARQVFLHYGVGPGAWQQVRDIPMTESSPSVWTCTIRAASGGRLEMCFHDGAGNWDNNFGKNWSYAIQTGLLH
ncbi:MAG: carbohydrate binding domain-containing protein [Limnochordia bacterium]